MTTCTQVAMEFPRCQRRVVEANFEGGTISSDGGVLLLRQADRYLGLSTAVARALTDPRRQASCTHNGASRWANRADRAAAGRIHAVMVDQFIASFQRAPKKLILDFDAADDAVHGRRTAGSSTATTITTVFLPWYVFCRDQLLVSYLRPSQIDGTKHAWAI